MTGNQDRVVLHVLKIGATKSYCDPICAGINDILELSKTNEVTSKASEAVVRYFWSVARV